MTSPIPIAPKHEPLRLSGRFGRIPRPAHYRRRSRFASVVAPDVGTAAALFAAVTHPERIASVIVGTGGAAVPLQLRDKLGGRSLSAALAQRAARRPGLVHRVHQGRSARQPPELQSDAPGRPVLCASASNAERHAACTTDCRPITSPLSRLALQSAARGLPTTRAVILRILRLLRVPPADFKIRCLTHLMHRR